MARRASKKRRVEVREKVKVDSHARTWTGEARLASGIGCATTMRVAHISGAKDTRTNGAYVFVEDLIGLLDGLNTFVELTNL